MGKTGTKQPDAIYRPTWAGFYGASVSSFDVGCAPSDFEPVRRLGFKRFRLTPFVPGGVTYTRDFKLVARAVWPRKEAGRWY